MPLPTLLNGKTVDPQQVSKFFYLSLLSFLSIALSLSVITDLVVELEAMGLQWMAYTDIARDGTLAGPNFEQLQTILNTVKKINVIASGGIGTLEDVRKLSLMKGLAAAITGKAIYEGKLDFKEALKLLK